MSVIFSLDQVLACTKSATSEYSTTSQCLSALLGRSGRVKFILNGLRWKNKKQGSYHSHTTTTWRLITLSCPHIQRMIIKLEIMVQTQQETGAWVTTPIPRSFWCRRYRWFSVIGCGFAFPWRTEFISKNVLFGWLRNRSLCQTFSVNPSLLYQAVGMQANLAKIPLKLKGQIEKIFRL